MRKKLVAGLLTGALAVAALTGCGDKADSTAAQSTESTETTETETADAASADAESADTQSADPVVIKIAASATPHA